MSDSDEISVEDELKLQVNRYEQLKKVLPNFKKDAQSRKTQSYFDIRLKRLNELYKEFSKSHKFLVCNIEHTDEYFTSDICTQFEEIYIETHSFVTEEYKKCFLQNAESDSSTILQTQIQHTSTIQPPNLPVPKFSGKFLDWPSFYDNPQFNSKIPFFKGGATR